MANIQDHPTDTNDCKLNSSAPNTNTNIIVEILAITGQCPFPLLALSCIVTKIVGFTRFSPNNRYN